MSCQVLKALLVEQVVLVVVVVVVGVGNARLFKRTHELLLNGGWVVSDVYI